MEKSLFRPPPPPPRTKPTLDPLMALSVKPLPPPPPVPRRTTPPPPPIVAKPVVTEAPKAMAAEELSSLTDDDLEMWAVGGTRILPKNALSQPPPAITATTSQPPLAIAPTLLEAAPNAYRPVSYPPVAMTQPSMAPLPPKKSNALLWFVGIAVVGIFGFIAVGGAVAFYIYQSQNAEEASAAPIIVPTTPQAAAQPAAVAPPAIQASAQTVAPLTTTQPASKSSETNTAPRSAAPAIAAAPQTTQPAQAESSGGIGGLGFAVAAPASNAKGTGTLRTFAAGAGKSVMVDGRQIGVGGSPLKAACGRHIVAVGSGHAKSYDIPCNGTITVGSADGS